MKKKRFFVKQHRSEKWTEQQTGRKIEFADKYLYDGSYSDKFDYKRPKQLNTVIEKEKKSAKTRKIVIAVLSVVLVIIGYTGMDLYMQIAAKPAKAFMQKDELSKDNLAGAILQISAKQVESVGLDNSVMLDSVITDLESNGFTSLVFDAKRKDGTIGYASNLATIDTYNLVSSPASKPQESVSKLIQNDILPIAKICTYQDNVLPTQAKAMAVLNDTKVYKDSNDNTYLNPNNDNVYNYIKDIVQELHSYGVNVFILYGCDIPSQAGTSYNDGFDSLATRLNNDLGTQIKFIKQIDVTINGENPQSQIDSLEALDKDEIYNIHTNLNHNDITVLLAEKGIESYVIQPN